MCHAAVPFRYSFIQQKLVKKKKKKNLLLRFNPLREMSKLIRQMIVVNLLKINVLYQLKLIEMHFSWNPLNQLQCAKRYKFSSSQLMHAAGCLWLETTIALHNVSEIYFKKLRGLILWLLCKSIIWGKFDGVGNSSRFWEIKLFTITFCCSNFEGVCSSKLGSSSCCLGCCITLGRR